MFSQVNTPFYGNNLQVLVRLLYLKKLKVCEHIDLDGNCILLEKGDKNEIKERILNLMDNNSLAKKFKKMLFLRLKSIFHTTKLQKNQLI